MSDSSGLLTPGASLQARLARRLADETGGDPEPLPSPGGWSEPEWEEVAPGAFCKLLADDAERHRVSLLVRLLPDVQYPAHTHAGVEELHILDGELWLDHRKLCAGDFSRAEAASGDLHVWTETGCTCLVTTSTRDLLR